MKATIKIELDRDPKELAAMLAWVKANIQGESKLVSSTGALILQ